MKVINIIDSLELNGGSTTFLEMAAGMHKYWKGDISSYVVSKTGLFGRKGLVDNGFAPSYKVPLEVYNYSSFEKKIVPKIRDCLIFHHVLGYTKSIKFHKSCKYVVINHRDVNLHRLPGFKAFKIVCVSDYFAKQVRKAKAGDPVVILNGCGDYYNTKPSHVSDKLVLGRCQRVTPAKFLNEKIRDERVSQYIIGPVDPKAKRLIPKGAKLFGPVFRLNEKIPIIKSFDLYLHGSPRPEGCSMAILEALSCGVPIVARKVGGGVNEIIEQGVNGFLYKNDSELKETISRFIDDKEYMKRMKESTHSYFLEKFHVKHMLDNYKRMFNDCGII